jgi:hypothetical protein
MYRLEQLTAQPIVARTPVEMPLNVLLALPDYITADPGAQRFNLPGAIGKLLGNSGLENALRVIRPHIWAPGWTGDQLYQFLTSPFLDRPELFRGISGESLRAGDFPGLGGLSDLSGNRTDYPRYEVIHFIGRIHKQQSTYYLDIGDKEAIQKAAYFNWVKAGRPEGDGLEFWLEAERSQPTALLNAMLTVRTRLLILQVPLSQIDDAAQLASQLVAGGGPAVLIAAARSPGTVDEYFLTLYANIIHNRSLSEAASPETWMEEEKRGLNVRLIKGQADDLLRFDRWLDSLRVRADALLETTRRQNASLSSLRSRAARLLHPSQMSLIEGRIRTAEQTMGGLTSNITSVTTGLAATLNWARETGGALPLSEIATALQVIEAGPRYPELVPELENDLNAQAAVAPRVLNANFADPKTRRMLEARGGLIPGEFYDLLVDVGPRWSKVQSIVIGRSDFPEDALPVDKEGYVVQVVVVSEDFSPHLVSAEIWVPRRIGRSFPYVNGNRAQSSGPVALRLRAPELPGDGNVTTFPVHARLCLYYENNLIQSAAVKVGLTTLPDVALAEDNVVEVDYVLTGGFQDVEECFTKRAVQFSSEERDGHPVMLNLTLNDDGGGGHRIVIKRRLVAEQGGLLQPAQGDSPPHGFTPYDPDGAISLLDRARNELLACFYKRDRQGNTLTGEVGVDRNTNGKTRDQFKWDLLKLAELGSELFSSAFDQVQLEDGTCTQAQWKQSLVRALTNASVIQVTRTVPVQYVFPWALVYEYPLVSAEREKWRFCPIIDEEWSPEGVRHLKERTCCPYHDSPRFKPDLPPRWHDHNILCPYGLWGLKHIIEEPSSLPGAKPPSLPGAKPPSLSGNLGNVRNEARVSPNFNLSVGVTSDPKLKTRIEAHLQKVKKIQNVCFAQLEPADDWDTVTQMLQAPEMVYLLCHGEYDVGKKKSYLSVGPRDNHPSHRIYEHDLSAWTLQPNPPGPDLDAWRKRGPLVFINGCHTSDIKPGKILSFVACFNTLGASGVLGTEASVLLPVAIEVAESLLTKLAQPQPIPVGQALREIRWQLANKGNILGLAYTLYGLADLHIVRDG